MKLIILVFQTVGTTDMHVDYGLVSSVHSMHLVGIQRKKKQRQCVNRRLVGKSRDLMRLHWGVWTGWNLGDTLGVSWLLFLDP
jgi:hypothetical protein